MGDILNSQQAIALFYEIADRLDIPFYAPLGCAQKCGHIIDLLDEQGVEAGSICASAHIRMQPMRVQFIRAMNLHRGWYFHVAALVPFMRENGEAGKLVFDPALFDGPVEVGQWKRALNAHTRELTTAEQGELLDVAGVKGFLDVAYSQSQIDFEYERLVKDYAQPSVRDVIPSEFCNRYFNQKRDIARRKRGPGWKSIKK